MKTLAAIAALLIAPSAALADQPAAPAAPATQPTAQPTAPEWSLGAGLVGFANLPLQPLGSFGLFTPLPLGVSVSVERALGGGRWAVMGATVQAARSRSDAERAFVTREDVVAADLVGGLRSAVTPPGAPVEISLLWLGEAGAGHVRTDTATSRTQDVQWLAASVGLAVERELLSRLSVRLSTSLVRLAWSHSSERVDGGPKAPGSSLSLSAAVAPSLELRLAF